MLLALANLNFATIDCTTFNDGDQYDLCMSLDFADGTDDFLVLTKDHGEDTVFVGKLRNEGTSATVIYDNDDIEVSKISNFL